MKLGRIQKVALILTAIGLVLYGVAKFWAHWHSLKMNADANIGAGVLGLVGLTISSLALMVFILITLFTVFKKH